MPADSSSAEWWWLLVAGWGGIQRGQWANIIVSSRRSSSVRDRARHRYKATSRTKRDGHKPMQGPLAPQPRAAAPLPSTGLLLDAPVPRAGFSRVPCTDSPGGRLSAERQRAPEHATTASWGQGGPCSEPRTWHLGTQASLHPFLSLSHNCRREHRTSACKPLSIPFFCSLTIRADSSFFEPNARWSWQIWAVSCTATAIGTIAGTHPETHDYKLRFLPKHLTQSTLLTQTKSFLSMEVCWVETRRRWLTTPGINNANQSTHMHHVHLALQAAAWQCSRQHNSGKKPW